MAASLLSPFHSVAAPLLRSKRQFRPAFHLAPPTGWINDPNGPMLAPSGDFHLFYQHVPESSEWQWGLVWGHAKSKDLVHWEHLPVALAPTPNSADQHGCFSGCATLDVDGRPTMLYTGVVRKPEHDIELGITPTYESQLLAIPADLSDPDLKEWVKLPGNFLPQPPADMDLTGWRDPFVLERPGSNSSSNGSSSNDSSSNGSSSNGNRSPWWYVMVGAGVRNKCGTALVYRSKSLTTGWEYVGPLCESPDSHMWECPIMALLSNTPQHIYHQQQQHHQPHNPTSTACATNGLKNGSGEAAPKHQKHMLCVSPDYCVNIPQYWLGDYESGKFDLVNADGPHPLDLGDILYAPNLLADKHGRTVLWAWMQEKQALRPPGTYNSACCLCVPRVLYLSPDGKHLTQEPLPELTLLRQQQGAWHIGAAAGNGAAAVSLQPGLPLDLGGGFGSGGSSHLDVEVTVGRGDANSFVVVLQPFDSGAVGAAGAGVSYCWKTHTLQVIHSTDLRMLEYVAAMDIEPPEHKLLPEPGPEERAAAAAAAAATGLPLRCGGHIQSSGSSGAAGPEGQAVKLRILVDGSCVEVFTCSGQALGTRVYRGDEPPVSPKPTSADAGHDAEAAAAGRLDSTVVPAATFADGVVANSAAAAKRNGQVQLVCFGRGPAELISCSTWQMGNMWNINQQQQAEEAATTAATAAAAEVLQGLVAAEVAAAAAAPLVLPVQGLSMDPTAAAGSHMMGDVPVSPSAGVVSVPAA